MPEHDRTPGPATPDVIEERSALLPEVIVCSRRLSPPDDNRSTPGAVVIPAAARPIQNINPFLQGIVGKDTV